MNTDISALFTIFGATGDLAHRKLYPSLFRLYKKGFINENFAVIGTARREWTNDYFHEVIAESVKDLVDNEDELVKFTSHFYYISHNVKDAAHYVELKKLSDRLDEKYTLKNNRIFYLAMAPEFFGTIGDMLKQNGLITKDGFSRLIIEKPFGSDLDTAKELNEQLSHSFTEDQIYRIDHYLGKEMVQNISAVRFSNMIFESLWNNKYIDNIQITLAETVGVEDRGGYYDRTGALRDMVQNHVLQIIALLVMEPPMSLSGEDVRAEKIKALRSLRVYKSKDEVWENFVRGQYTSNDEVAGYLDEPNVNSDSDTETFVAGKISVDNFRWAGVPFYIRTGKRMAQKETYIHVQFKHVSMDLFPTEDVDEIAEPNILTIHISPLEGFSLRLNTKKVGQGTEMKNIRMHQIMDEETLMNSPEAYERLLLDCLNGDPTNFTHWQEVEQSWRFIDQIRKIWDEEPDQLYQYESGTMGPKESYQLLEKDGNNWIEFNWKHTK
ncbi:glucose-6-phosphate dehydrogenase [Jeotgalibaca ciconiae]|uniref:Glucose-6-phosphate 1-dehydrogenase n=1 Tax=Jeotgalibaca ciconiae TaxID=2496265 RepID=A0A3Q9BLU7_9LACT|nr:glucose-6-phosphate dehydrogenase [Jeotgalibaca ciconiae]AZP05250.1 glucose-6-phosphate dehydrogenase [Jeotgalibaca ciconiae]HJB22998.1 glucose-6-phosphate dehydrogenase [Candidatus Jeotgalibaca pullicola]